MKLPKDRVALVTGGGSGLGKAIALKLQDDGVKVAISDVDSSVGAATAKAAGFHFVEQDVANEARWNEVVAKIEAHFGSLCILVNNAGIVGAVDSDAPENGSLDNWRKVFAVNVEGVFLGCRAAIPAMRRAGGGAIVNISSTAALVALPQHFAYSASKAAVRHMTKSLAQYCAEQGINVTCNSVHPGNVMTSMWKDTIAVDRARTYGISVADAIDEALASSPLEGSTTPEDIADAVSFLVSDNARRITGMEMIVDGGVVNCSTYHSAKHMSARRSLKKLQASVRS